MDKLHHIAINSVLKKVYELEERTGGEVIVIRGKSAHVMASLKPETFDFVYVDGSHYYWDVFRDIELAKMLIKDGGCLCGDDLETEPCAEIEAIAREHLDHDFITVRMSDGSGGQFSSRRGTGPVSTDRHGQSRARVLVGMAARQFLGLSAASFPGTTAFMSTSHDCIG